MNEFSTAPYDLAYTVCFPEYPQNQARGTCLPACDVHAKAKLLVFERCKLFYLPEFVALRRGKSCNSLRTDYKGQVFTLPSPITKIEKAIFEAQTDVTTAYQMHDTDGGKQSAHP